MSRFTYKDVATNFESQIFSRGRDYAEAGKVLRVEAAPGAKIIGLVKGSHQEPYQVELNIIHDECRIVGTCSCLYAHQCKHAAAVALKALEKHLLDEEQEDS